MVLMVGVWYLFFFKWKSQHKPLFAPVPYPWRGVGGGFSSVEGGPALSAQQSCLQQEARDLCNEVPCPRSILPVTRGNGGSQEQ